MNKKLLLVVVLASSYLHAADHCTTSELYQKACKAWATLIKIRPVTHNSITLNPGEGIWFNKKGKFADKELSAYVYYLPKDVTPTTAYLFVLPQGQWCHIDIAGAARAYQKAWDDYTQADDRWLRSVLETTASISSLSITPAAQKTAAHAPVLSSSNPKKEH
jgi:hypothetical protein